MSSLVSPRVTALIAKLRQAEHAGQYFSAEDVAGLIRELRSVNDGVKALEDEIAGSRRASQRRSAPTGAPAGFEEEWRTSAKFRMAVAEQRAQAVGTFYFVPAEGRA